MSEDRQECSEFAEFPIGPPVELKESTYDAIRIKDININDEYDILDNNNRWCEGAVLKIDYENHRLYIGYLNWDSKFDDWVSLVKERVAPLHTYTYTLGGVFRVRQRLEVLDERGVWLEAFVEDLTECEVKIHYKGFAPKFDEWMDKKTDRIRPFRRAKTHVQRRREAAKQWKVPGQQHVMSEHNKENMGLKRPFSATPSEGDDGHDATVGAPSDDRKRKIVASSENYNRYLSALASHSLEVFPVSGDGNCLFRSVAHQVYGDDALHELVRARCLDYMESEADFFCQFVEGGRDTFPLYLAAKRRNGCWGDDPEIEAVCELYNRPAEIWAFDPMAGAKKLRTFHESTNSTMQSVASTSNNSAVNSPRGGEVVMRLSYYGGGHYDSISDHEHRLNVIRRTPGEVEDLAIARSRNRVAMGVAGRRVSESDVRSLSDAAATEQITLDLALQESRRCQAEADYEDLESCLTASLQNYHATVGSSSSIADPTLSVNNDLIAIQSDLLRSVREQSEREFLEKALISSLSPEAAVTDQDVLESARRESEREFEEALAISRLENSSGLATHDLDFSHLLSGGATVSEEEELERALRESIQQSAPHRDQSAGGTSFNTALASNEDDELQRALNASMSDYHHLPSTQNSSSGGGGGAFFVSGSGAFLEEMDEELVRAIEASLRK